MKRKNESLTTCLMFILFLLVLFVIGCSSGGDTNRKTVNENEHVMKVTVLPLHFPTGWGYVVKKNNELYIYQDQIPCLPGNKQFPTRESAMQVAHLVKQKINLGRSPSVSRSEIEKILNSPIKNSN